MAYTLTTAVAEVRALINEDTPSFWSDADIQEWIQQGVLDWTEKSLLHTVDDTITLVSGTHKYTTSGSSHISNAIRCLHATYNDVALQRISFEQMHGHNARKLSSDKTPRYYFDIYNGTTFTFYLNPTPSATEDGGTVNVIFAKQCTDITLIPAQYQPTIFDFAAHKAKFRERQYQEASLYYQKYVNNIAFARQDGLQRGIQPTAAFRIQ